MSKSEEIGFNPSELSCMYIKHASPNVRGMRNDFECLRSNVNSVAHAVLMLCSACDEKDRGVDIYTFEHDVSPYGKKPFRKSESEYVPRENRCWCLAFQTTPCRFLVNFKSSPGFPKLISFL